LRRQTAESDNFFNGRSVLLVDEQKNKRRISRKDAAMSRLTIINRKRFLTALVLGLGAAQLVTFAQTSVELQPLTAKRTSEPTNEENQFKQLPPVAVQTPSASASEDVATSDDTIQLQPMTKLTQTTTSLPPTQIEAASQSTPATTTSADLTNKLITNLPSVSSDSNATAPTFLTSIPNVESEPGTINVHPFRKIGDSFGAPVDLSPMNDNTEIPAYLTSTLADPPQNEPINLPAQKLIPEPLPEQSGIAMSPTGNQSKNEPTLSVEAMIGTQADPSYLLAQSNSNTSLNYGAELLPYQRGIMSEEGPVDWGGKAYFWQSPAFCHKPLYFEQPNLERYGQGPGCPYNSVASASRFAGQVVTLPAAMLFTPPWSCECTLGNHRPGNCAPYQRKPDHPE
jgi:hypothetical protein